MRILVVEDEYLLADLIANRLRKEKYLADISLDGEAKYTGGTIIVNGIKTNTINNQFMGDGMSQDRYMNQVDGGRRMR